MLHVHLIWKFPTLNINVKSKELTVTEQKIWEVFFDHKEEGSDKGHRIDPLDP